MKERTLKLLARVQAVREKSTRRRLEEASREAKESEEQAESLSRERNQVLENYGSRQGALAEQADRYAEVLKRREESTRDELVARMAEREDARREFLRVMLKSDILSRHVATRSQGSE